MGYQKTDLLLDQALLEKGFQKFPTSENKYYDKKGSIIWTDGSWFQSGSHSKWERYGQNGLELEKRSNR